MPKQSPVTSPTAAEVLGQLNQGLQLYLDPTLCKPNQWANAISCFSGAFGFIQRARYANVVNPITSGYFDSGQRFTSLKFFASPGIGNYLIGDVASLSWGFDTGNNYAATLRFGSSPFGFNSTGPWSREILENIVYEMNGAIKQTGRGANAATLENWGLNTPDVSSQVVISSGFSQNITSITRLNGVVTVVLAGALSVPGGNGVGMINVIGTTDLGFVGTFVVETGAGTATLTWNQEGLNTSSSGGAVNTNILKSIGRSYSYAWENANKPHVSAPSPATQYIQYQNQNGVIQLVEQGTVAVVSGSTAVTGTGTAFTSAWVGRDIWIETNIGTQKFAVLSVTDPTHLIMLTPWDGATGAGHAFQIYDFDVTNIRLYATSDGGPTYFEIQRNTWNPLGSTLLAAGLEFFDNANAEPPNFPFTTEISQLNNVPPPIGAFVKEYQGVLIVYGGTIPGQTFFYSNQTLTTVGLQQESFAPLNQITLPIQNAVINGMVELPGALIIWSDKQDMFRLTGLLTDNTASQTPTQQGATITALPYNLGCASPFAVALTPLGVIWVTSNAEVWLFTDSYAPRNIGQPIQSILRSIAPADLGKCRMAYYHTFNRNWVALSVPVEGTSANNTILLLDLDLLASNGSPSYFVFDMASNQPVWYQLMVPSDAPAMPQTSLKTTRTAISVPDGLNEETWATPNNATLNTPGTYATATLNISSPGTNGIGAFDPPSANNSGTITGTTHVSAGTVTPSTPPEFAIFGQGNSAGVAFTPDAGWTTLGGQSFQQEATGGALAGGGTLTLGGTEDWAAGIVMFKQIGPSAPTVIQPVTIVSGAVLIGTHTSSFSSPVTAGSTILVIMEANQSIGGPGLTVNDTSGSNVYTKLVDVTGPNNNPSYTVYAAANVAGGTYNINAIVVNNAFGAAITAYEIQGGVPTIISGPTSEQLECTNFGFAIPTGAAIQGLQLTIGGHQSDLDAHSLVNARLLSPTGTTTLISQLPSLDGLITLGGPTQQWGALLSPAAVNSPSFGFKIQATTTDGITQTFNIYEVGVTVFYTLPNGLAGPGAVPLETVYETAGNVRLEAASFDLITDLDYSGRGSGTEIPVEGALVETHAWGNDTPFILKRPKFFRFNTNRDPASLAVENIVGIANIARSLGQVTAITVVSHGLSVGDWAFINTVADPSFNGVFQVTGVPTNVSVQWSQALPDATSTGGALTNGWAFGVEGIDDDFYGFDNPLTLDLVPGLNDAATLGGNPAQFTVGSPFRVSQELYRVGGVNFVMGRRLKFLVKFPSTPGAEYQFRSVQIGFGPSPPR